MAWPAMLDWPARRIAERAARQAVDDTRRLVRDSMREEVAITNALAANLERRLAAASSFGHLFNVTTLIANGVEQEETRFGGDLQVTLVTPSEFKWLLIQAKRGDRIHSEWRDLEKACNRMAKFGAAAGLVYYRDLFIGALARRIANGSAKEPPEGITVGSLPADWEDFKDLFAEFVRCSVGSRNRIPVLHPSLILMINYGRNYADLARSRDLAEQLVPDGYERVSDDRWNLPDQDVH